MLLVEVLAEFCRELFPGCEVLCGCGCVLVVDRGWLVVRDDWLFLSLYPSDVVAKCGVGSCQVGGCEGGVGMLCKSVNLCDPACFDVLELWLGDLVW